MGYDAFRHSRLPINRVSHCPARHGATASEAVPYRIDEIHISQQYLSTFGIRTYTLACLTRVELI